DQIGLTAKADYDYRVLQPREFTDPNGNRVSYTFTTLGLLESTAIMGKPGDTVGDTETAPSLRLVYDFRAFLDRNEPISVRTIRRVHHTNDIDVNLPERNNAIETVEYSDGLGRLIQRRTQAEDITFGDTAFANDILPA